MTKFVFQVFPVFSQLHKGVFLVSKLSDEGTINNLSVLKQMSSSELEKIMQIEFTKYYFHCSMQHVLQYTQASSHHLVKPSFFCPSLGSPNLFPPLPFLCIFIPRKYEGCFNLNFDIRSHILAPFLKFRRTCHLRVLSVFVGGSCFQVRE